jgi:hypothetical protein
MKKILGIVSLLMVVAACSYQPATNHNMGSNENTASKSAPLPVSEADIIAKEKAAWDTLKKKDYDAFGKLLASDYIEISDGGVFDKAGIIADVKDFDLADVTFADWKMLPIDNDAVIITYTTTVKGTYKGEPVPSGPYRSAGAWVDRNGNWQAIYFQQTRITPPPPPPPPPAQPPPPAKSGQPAKTAASPAAKPAETGPDPIANEKIVWDAFLSKNYDAFAALLAPEFFELESYAVFDKAGAVKGVTEFDAAKFELSDWKALTIDGDASLVTYLVKPTDPKWTPERHSSIWVNRNGKWLALFHMGTPVAKPAAKPAAKSSPKSM